MISSSLDRMRVDRLRASSEAIMVSGPALLGDDPCPVLKTKELQAARLAAGNDINPLKNGALHQGEIDKNG